MVRIHPDPPVSYRGCSSVGRAPALQAGGHRFDPVHLHHFERKKAEDEEGDGRLIQIPERSQVSPEAYFWSFDRRGCSLFNNSEEASASISQDRCMGCDCIDLIPSSQMESGTSVRIPVARTSIWTKTSGPRLQGYRVKRISAYGGCLGDHRRRRT